MTGQAERIRESHRGWLKAEPASKSRLSALATFGLRFIQIDDFNVVVEGEYELNLAMSYWRAADGSSQGYLVSALAAEIGRTKIIEREPTTRELVAAIGKRSKEKPATDRDSAQVELETVELHRCAESVAGHHSSSLLPVVSP